MSRKPGELAPLSAEMLYSLVTLFNESKEPYMQNLLQSLWSVTRGLRCDSYDTVTPARLTDLSGLDQRTLNLVTHQIRSPWIARDSKHSADKILLLRPSNENNVHSVDRAVEFAFRIKKILMGVRSPRGKNLHVTSENLLISGSLDSLDFDDLRLQTNHARGYQGEHTVIEMFWKFLKVRSAAPGPRM
ncbi:hypothetical protein VNO77_22771 [Canavalia gladiata]|uniref:HECT domain-containing protein n=1 Tax=Canavalia gladiata TaxID=3824 RepID=A0AAN9L5T4_CANGL